MLIFILRHGQSVMNAQGRLPLDDTPLTDKGRGQARKNAQYLTDKQVELIFSSTKTRAHQTAEIIAEKTKCEIVLRDPLKDYNFGILCGREKDGADEEAKRIMAEWAKDKINYRIEGGENYHDLKARVVPIVNEILSSGKKVAAVVSHLYVNRIIIAQLLGMQLDETLSIEVPNEIIYVIDTETKKVYHVIEGIEMKGLLLKKAS